MININKVADRICMLRKEKGLSQEALAGILNVSSQAVSKWENAKALPDTSILPLLAKTLGSTIDRILTPQELQILSAVYTDGDTSIDVTHLADRFVIGSEARILVNEQVLGKSIPGERTKFLIIKYHNPKGTYFAYAKKEDFIMIDGNSAGYAGKPGELQYLYAVYGNEDTFMDVMHRLEHLRFFKPDCYQANHECFPSPPENDGGDYLSIVYLNESGIHAVSCAEGEKIRFGQARTELFREGSREGDFIIENVRKLEFGKGMDCSWAGALYTALGIMGVNTTYETVMGVSGACWRIAFCRNCWDYSSAHGLVAYDYATPGYKAFGYPLIWADRIDKKDRKIERRNIMDSIRSRKPPIAINMRIAPEWGVMTGYLEEGRSFLCRTYFDDQIFVSPFPSDEEIKDFTEEMKKTKGYLYVDNWPFAVAHFGERGAVPSDYDNFLNSMRVKVDSMRKTEGRGYRTGYAAYEEWRGSLLEDEWYRSADDESFKRRLSVNHFLMQALADARRCARIYLEGSVPMLDGEAMELAGEIAGIYQAVDRRLSEFYAEVPDDESCKAAEPRRLWTVELRREQADVLGEVATLERRADELADRIIETCS